MTDEARHIKVDPVEKKSEAKVGLVAMLVLVLLIGTLWIVKARKHDPRDTEMMKAREAAMAPKDTVAELSLSSTAPMPPGRMEEVSRALAPAAKMAAGCMEGIYATVFVEVILGPDGKVREARFSSRNQLPVDKLLEGTCFLDKLRQPTVSPGVGDITAFFPVRNMPSQKMMEETAKGIVDGKTPVVPVP